MEIDIVGPQCHLTAARNINHIFNCKLLTFPHYCFVVFFFSLQVCVCVWECLKGWYQQWGKRSTAGVCELRTSLFHPFLLSLSLFLMWKDVNISKMTPAWVIQRECVHWYWLWSTQYKPANTEGIRHLCILKSNCTLVVSNLFMLLLYCDYGVLNARKHHSPSLQNIAHDCFSQANKTYRERKPSLLISRYFYFLP